MQNVSKQGLLLHLASTEHVPPLKRGEIFEVRFLLQESLIIRCNAEVVRKERNRDHDALYGLRITYMDHNSRSNLYKYLARPLAKELASPKG